VRRMGWYARRQEFLKGLDVYTRAIDGVDRRRMDKEGYVLLWTIDLEYLLQGPGSCFDGQAHNGRSSRPDQNKYEKLIHCIEPPVFPPLHRR